jgi:uncharacterized membrane protein
MSNIDEHVDTKVDSNKEKSDLVDTDTEEQNQELELTDAKNRESELVEFLSSVPEEVLVKVLASKMNEPPETVPKIIQEVVSHQHYSGPIPPPIMLDQYEEVHGGLATRIVSMAEIEQHHRHQIENTAISGEISKDKRGQFFALITSILIISGSIGLISFGHEVSGTVLMGTTVLGLAYMFITGKHLKNNHKDE